MKNENQNTMEGDIVNEETSIYDTEKPPVEKITPKKQLQLPNIDFLTLKKFIPKLKILIILFVFILLVCVGLLVLSKRSQNQDLPKENPIVQNPSPTSQTDPKIIELTKKVEQFKKDTDESVITKKLTPPLVDLNLNF